MKFVVKQNVLKIEESRELCSGTINCLKTNVEFDEAWDGLIKEAIMIKEFETEGERIAIVNDQICISRSKKGKYFIGFIGYRIEEEKKVFQLSTNLEAIVYDKGAGEVEAKEPEELPTPTQWELYMAETNKVINEANSLDVELGDNVLTITKKDGTKQSANVKGDQGEQGPAGTTDYNKLENKPDLSNVATIEYVDNKILEQITNAIGGAY